MVYTLQLPLAQPSPSPYKNVQIALMQEQSNIFQVASFFYIEYLTHKLLLQVPNTINER